MMFIVALYLPWCRYLAAQEGVEPQLHAHNLKCVFGDPPVSSETVDRGILDKVLSSLGLPGWFRHAHFEYHSHVRLRFKLSAGLGRPWTGDGCIPQGCLLSMMFVVALYLPWWRYLGAQDGVQPQLFADKLKCDSRDPGVLVS